MGACGRVLELLDDESRRLVGASEAAREHAVEPHLRKRTPGRTCLLDSRLGEDDVLRGDRP